MSTTVGPNIELSRCTATSIRSCARSEISVVKLPVHVNCCFANRGSASSLVSREVEGRRSRKDGITYSMSRSNEGSIGENDRLTYKSAGVDIDAGTELVRRIAKMAPGIGGFGGLYPFGMVY